MTRNEINHLIAHSAGVDPVTTERVLLGLEHVILTQMAQGGNKFGRLMTLYQNWKNG